MKKYLIKIGRNDTAPVTYDLVGTISEVIEGCNNTYSYKDLRGNIIIADCRDEKTLWRAFDQSELNNIRRVVLDWKQTNYTYMLSNMIDLFYEYQHSLKNQYALLTYPACIGQIVKIDYVVGLQYFHLFNDMNRCDKLNEHFTIIEQYEVAPVQQVVKEWNYRFKITNGYPALKNMINKLLSPVNRVKMHKEYLSKPNTTCEQNEPKKFFVRLKQSTRVSCNTIYPTVNATRTGYNIVDDSGQTYHVSQPNDRWLLIYDYEVEYLTRLLIQWGAQSSKSLKTFLFMHFDQTIRDKLRKKADTKLLGSPGVPVVMSDSAVYDSVQIMPTSWFPVRPTSTYVADNVTSQHTHVQWVKDTRMSTGYIVKASIADNTPASIVSIETVTLVNGADSRSLSLSRLIDYIKRCEQRIDTLKQIKVSSKYIDNQVQLLTDTINKLVIILDSKVD